MEPLQGLCLALDPFTITSELEYHIKRYGMVRCNIEALKAVVIRMSACSRMSHLPTRAAVTSLLTQFVIAKVMSRLTCCGLMAHGRIPKKKGTSGSASDSVSR